MCLTYEALTLFISLLAADIIEYNGDQITIHAETRPVVWQATQDKWCTRGPQIDAMLRLNGGESV